MRDPVRRLLSCYANRVVYYGELSEAAAGPTLRAAGLRTNPGLSEFIHRLADYSRAVPSIAHHSAPQTSFLGTDVGYNDAVFPMERISEFAKAVAETIGQPIKIPRLENYGPKFDAAALPEVDLTAPRRHYATDFEIWGQQCRAGAAA